MEYNEHMLTPCSLRIMSRRIYCLFFAVKNGMPQGSVYVMGDERDGVWGERSGWDAAEDK